MRSTATEALSAGVAVEVVDVLIRPLTLSFIL
jgi:hypothetical protein